MKEIFVILLFSSISFTCNKKHDVSNVTIYLIGETKVSVVEKRCYPCDSHVLFVNLHDNEITSVKAAEQYLNEIGGRIINIENNGERLINFRYKGEDFTFDPNRIYSSAGIDSTITILSLHYNSDAAKEVADFAKHFIADFINGSHIIISLHNNMDSSLSVISYKNMQAGNDSLGRTFINPAMDADDFMLTTDTSLFARIKEKNINAVYENVEAIKDDGSLSVYAARHNIPYINVEAQHEHLKEQLSMLKAIDDLIREYMQETHNRR